MPAVRLPRFSFTFSHVSRRELENTDIAGWKAKGVRVF